MIKNYSYKFYFSLIVLLLSILFFRATLESKVAKESKPKTLGPLLISDQV